MTNEQKANEVKVNQDQTNEQNAYVKQVAEQKYEFGFTTNVLTGFIYGAIAGILVYLGYHKLYNRISPKINYISTQYTSTGYSKTDLDVVIGLMVLILAVAIIGALINVLTY